MERQHLVVVPPSRTRSRVTNGRSPFVEADARTAWARRFKDLCALYGSHIGGSPNAPQASLIRRIATIDIECERVEGQLAEGATDVDFDAYSRWSGNLRRLLEQLGFDRAVREEVMDLKDYIRDHDRRKQEFVNEPA